MTEAWQRAQAFESNYWGLDWSPTWDYEIVKHRAYFRLMGLGDRADFGERRFLDAGMRSRLTPAAHQARSESRRRSAARQRRDASSL